MRRNMPPNDKRHPSRLSRERKSQVIQEHIPVSTFEFDISQMDNENQKLRTSQK